MPAKLSVPCLFSRQFYLVQFVAHGFAGVLVLTLATSWWLKGGWGVLILWSWFWVKQWHLRKTHPQAIIQLEQGADSWQLLFANGHKAHAMVLKDSVVCSLCLIACFKQISTQRAHAVIIWRDSMPPAQYAALAYALKND